MSTQSTIQKHGTIDDVITSQSYSVDSFGIITLTINKTIDLTNSDIQQSDVQSMPNTTYGNLRCVSASVSQNDQGIGTRTEVYMGTNGTHYRYRLTTSGAQEPIQTHPDFKTTLAGDGDSPLNNAVFKGEEVDSEFDYFPPNAGNDLEGVSAYLEPAMEVEVTVVTISGSMADPTFHSLYNNIGEIRTPTGGGAPALPLGRNWLLTGSSQEIIGGAVKATYLYRMSGRKGWNSLIYS